MKDWKWCYFACGADLVLILFFFFVDAWERVTIPIANGGICYIGIPDLGLRRVNLGIFARGEPACIYGLCHVLYVVTDADAAVDAYMDS